MSRNLRLKIPFIVLLLIASQEGMTRAQSTQWLVGTSIVDFSTPAPAILPLPGLSPDEFLVSNAVFDRVGNLQLYVVATRERAEFLSVYRGDGTLVDDQLRGTLTNHEIALVPVPGYCSRYYIIYFSSSEPGRVDLLYSVVDIAQNLILERDINIRTVFDTSGAIAITRPRSDGSRWLYAVGNPMVLKYEIGANGILEKSTILTTSTPGVTLFSFFPKEAELSADERLLAWTSSYGSPSRLLISHLDSNGDFAGLSSYSAQHTTGLEFFADGSRLYFGDESRILYVPTAVDNAVPTVVAGTEGYGNSLLEKATNGLLYAAGNNDLLAIDPNTAAVVGTLPVVAGIVDTSFGTTRSLPEQIEGEGITFGCDTCLKPPKDLIAWWPFDESGGTVAADITGNSNSGKAMNGAASSSGVIGGARRFDGVDDFILAQSGITAPFSGPRFSIDFWIRPDNGEAFGSILQKGVQYPFGPAFELGYCNSGHFCGVFNADSSSNRFEADLSLGTLQEAPPGVWTFVALTVDLEAHTASLYVNGQLAKTTPLPSTISSFASTNPLTIAAPANLGRPFGPFAGRLDELEIFDRTLSQAEIADIYQAKTGKCKSLCHTTWEAPCKSPGTGNGDMTICNNSTMTQRYDYTIKSLQATDALCNLDGPSGFSPSSGNVTVPPFDCRVVPLTIECPAGQPSRGHGCFELNVQSETDASAFSCAGSYYTSRRWILRPVDPFHNLPFTSEPVEIVFEATNLGPGPDVLPYSVTALPSDMSSPNTAVSVANQPPGDPSEGVISLPEGGSALISTPVHYLANRPFQFYDLLIIADPESTGDSTPIASTGLHSKLVDCDANAVDDTLDIERDSGIDCNHNGVPDSCDIANQTSRDCNRNGRPDSCDIASGSAIDLNLNERPDSCEQGSVTCEFDGLAQGGSVEIVIQGFTSTCMISVLTFSGETASQVAIAVAAAVNSDTCLGSQDISAIASGPRVYFHGFLLQDDSLSTTILDPGLEHEVIVPTLASWGLLILALALAAGGIEILRRR